MKYYTRAIASLTAAVAAAFCVATGVTLGVDTQASLLSSDFLDFSKASDDPYVINGDRLMHDRTTSVAYAVGNAVVTRGGEVMRADSIRVSMTNRMAYAEGNVSVTRGDDELKCNRLRMDLSNNVAWAVGNVVLSRGKDVSTGETMTYDFKNRRVKVDSFEGSSGQFKVWATSAEQRGTNVLVLHDAVLSTCTNTKNHLHFYIKAKTLTVTQGESLKIGGATWYLGPVPVFYLPGWYRDLSSNIGFRVRPGYASRWGGFLLTSYRVDPVPWFESETRLDYRTRRGVAGGQDLRWHAADNSARGLFTAYYADDRDPIDVEDDAEAEDLDTQRYRLRLVHEWNVTARDQFSLKLDYLSDTDVVEDFYGREFRGERIPENYVAVVHRGESFSAGLLYSRRLNDFYATVDRAPEASVSLFRSALGDSGFYYEGEGSASLLEQTIARTGEGDPYSSARIDADNRLYYPFSPLSGVSLVPRVGYRLTYYSESPPVEGEQEEDLASGGGVLRRVPEYGMEASVRLSRVWPDEVRPYRHVVEPYADYTRILEPSARPFELYQFDDVDEVDTTHNVKVGVRNTLQTKRNGDPCTLADINIFTVVNIDPALDEQAVDILSLESDVMPYDPLRFDVDLDYSRVNHAVESVDARLSYDAKGSWLLNMGYLVRRDSRRLLKAETGVRFGAGWRALVFGGYEFAESQMQERGISLRRALDCMMMDLEVTQIPAYPLDDGTQRPDEWTVSFALVFTAFPDLGLGGRSSSK